MSQAQAAAALSNPARQRQRLGSASSGQVVASFSLAPLPRRQTLSHVLCTGRRVTASAEPRGVILSRLLQGQDLSSPTDQSWAPGLPEGPDASPVPSVHSSAVAPPSSQPCWALCWPAVGGSASPRASVLGSSTSKAPSGLGTSSLARPWSRLWKESLALLVGCLAVALALPLALPQRAGAKGSPAQAVREQAPTAAPATAGGAEKGRLQSSLEAGIAAQAGAGAGTSVADKKTAAVATLEGFVEKHPDDVEALKMLLRLRLKSADFASALGALDSLMRLQPQEREWRFLHAQLLELAGDLPGARRGFEAIIEGEPLSARAMQGLASVMRQSGEDSLVLGMVETAVKTAGEQGKKQEETNLKLLLAQLHALQGNAKQALALYDEILGDNPTDFRPYLCKGLVLSLAGDTDGADRLFQQFRQRCPKAYYPYLDSVIVRTSADGKRREMEERALKVQSSQGRAAKLMKQPTLGAGQRPGV